MATKKVKKDFDKERMYAKIMPSVFIEPPPLSGLEDTPPQQEDTEPDGGAPGTAGEQPESSLQPAYILRNYMEDIVLEKYAHTMKMLRACTCEKCKKDVIAHTLNELPAAYMAIPPDDIDAAVHRLRSSVEVKVSSALIKAVQYIKGAPGH